MSLNAVNPALVPPGVAPVAQPAQPAGGRRGETAVQGPSFGEVLRSTTQTPGVEFSRHALQRLERRGIELGEQTLARLTDGVDRAAGKGSRESVVFVDGTAFVVSVRNRTVITAVDPEHMREHVFTNIDSAVIA
ncbi:TIGR02530 family flagellar biosynthesis protein [Conexibacter stalactiti]|uniref:TIGR02530 family flagellar biosynthesis protein n=1 Tax=Conexibacter stalactiti TaxID=1940611 RepID=A0ABU4HWJ9_9ACTN|nr:TIGR02530 family flagellar biosynthesis protein [Conexibacter stalactiti]MDW5597700.1 TIGR02530 family flagellar biosynthesis protein [Conexibacter stalactiti]MEC5038342.1 TIGR02530 family flagellar biosynthesis protein [Conexibacter stalactiti]